MKALKIIGGFIMSIILIVLVIIAISYLYANNNGGTPYFLDYTTFIDTGTSMLPTYEEGDLLVVKKLDNYFEDDVITFKNDENTTVTHRIIDQKEEGYITKGDNNMFIDGYAVRKNDIYGKVVFRISNVGILIKYIIKYKYIIILSILGVAVFIFIAKYGVKRDS